VSERSVNFYPPRPLPGGEAGPAGSTARSSIQGLAIYIVQYWNKRLSTLWAGEEGCQRDIIKELQYSMGDVDIYHPVCRIDFALKSKHSISGKIITEYQVSIAFS
jgi:hypothetical protein